MDITQNEIYLLVGVVALFGTMMVLNVIGMSKEKVPQKEMGRRLALMGVVESVFILAALFVVFNFDVV